MNSFPTAATTQPLLEDDFSFYISFFQDDSAAPPASPPTSISDMPKGRRRREAGASASGEERRKKRKTIANLLTSIAAIDAQDESERRESDEDSRRELSLLEENHHRKAEVMLDYYSRLEDNFSALDDDADTLRSKRVRVAASAVAAAAAAASASDCKARLVVPNDRKNSVSRDVKLNLSERWMRTSLLMCVSAQLLKGYGSSFGAVATLIVLTLVCEVLPKELGSTQPSQDVGIIWPKKRYKVVVKRAPHFLRRRSEESIVS
ncbi:hypothetical protein C4D60_Mb07t03520 [Musa balbisiana]|uniref:Uncharacterized protein n=1 Tax=Musa balbisiana TaxID=52838 RepID=A0A4S8JCN7_MUSBA|nr:hypothetical protein C4D60_Mb07t03520 [Musa balbisiana]